MDARTNTRAAAGAALLAGVAVAIVAVSCSYGAFDGGSAAASATLIGGAEQMISLEGNFTLHVPAGAVSPPVAITITPMDPIAGISSRRYQVTPSVALLKPASAAFSMPVIATPSGTLVVAYSETPDGPFAPLVAVGTSGGGPAGSGSGPSPNFIMGLTTNLGTFALVPATLTDGAMPDCLRDCCVPTGNQSGVQTISRAGTSCFCNTNGGATPPFGCFEGCAPSDLATQCKTSGLGGATCGGGSNRCANGQPCCFARPASPGSTGSCQGSCGGQTSATCTTPADCASGQNCCVNGDTAMCSSAPCARLQACIPNLTTGCADACDRHDRCPFNLCAVQGASDVVGGLIAFCGP